MQVIRKASFTVIPWKNGGGITHEALRVPADGEAFRWRVSVAHIGASGPFSDFTGYRRRMVLLQGDGVALKYANGERQVLRRIGDQAGFDGALSVHCELLGGPCVDLNLMVSESVVMLNASVVRLDAPCPVSVCGAQWLLVFCVEGAAVLHKDGGDCVNLDTWDLAVLSQEAATLSRLPGDCSSVFLATLLDAGG